MMVLFTRPVRAASSASESARSPLRKADSTVSARSAEATPSTAGRDFDPSAMRRLPVLSLNLPCRPERLQPGAQDASRLALRDEELPPVDAAKAEIGGGGAGAGGDAERRLGPRREPPDRANPGMRDQQVALRIPGQPVRAAGAAMQVAENPGLGDGPVPVQRQAPDLIGTGHGDEEVREIRGHDDAVRAGHRADQQLEPPLRSQAIDAPGRVVQSGLPLVGEEDAAIGAKAEVVQPLEALASRRLQPRRDAAARRVDADQATLVVGDQQLAVRQYLQPVRPA